MKEKRAAGKRAFVISMLLGAAVSLAAYFALLALEARLVLSGAAGEERLPLLIGAAAFAAALIGGRAAAGRCGSRAAAASFASAGAFAAALYLLGFVLYDDPSLGKYGAAILASALAGGAVSALWTRRGRRGKKHKISQKRLKKT